METESNWVVDSVLDLSETIQESSVFPEDQLAHLLDEDKCFSLTRPRGSNASCHIKIRGGDVTPGTQKVIKGLLLHSEARVVEVYAGEHEEYIKTEHGRRIGEYEDTEMSACEVRLKPPRHEVKLAFKHTYNPNCVWVFGLHVVTETVNVESRFGCGHLSSVLKEKEVNVSKDGARLLHFLETFNGAGKLNENNNMALMSMFLGGQIGRNGPTTKASGRGEAKNRMNQSDPKAAMEKNGHNQRRNFVASDSNETITNDVEDGMKVLAISEESNGNEEEAAEGNNNTGGNVIQDPWTKSLPPPAQPAAAAAFASLLHPSTQPSSQPLTMQALMESLNMKSTATSNFQPSQSAAPGPAHSTPRAKGSDTNAWPSDDVSGAFSLEGSGLLLKEIENMIDRKFAQMEERLMKRIEDKIAEKAEVENKRLERIEEQCLKLCEHLLR